MAGSGIERNFGGKVRRPPIHDPIRLGEKTMTPDIDPISAVRARAGKASDVLRFLENDRADVGARQKLVGRGQPGGARTDNESDFLLTVHACAYFPAFTRGLQAKSADER